MSVAESAAKAMEKISDSAVGAMNGIKDQLNSVTGKVEEQGEVLGEVVEEQYTARKHRNRMDKDLGTAKKELGTAKKEIGTAKKERLNLFGRMETVETKVKNLEHQRCHGK